MDKQDGFITDLFSFLNKPNPIKHQVLEVNIPDTIIYRNSIPRQWYFTIEGQVKLKSKAKLDDQYIKEYFLKKKTDIIALWISSLDEAEILYEYLDEERFLKFINSSQLREGVLQKFIMPKGDFNHTIKSMWTKQCCYFEKYTSQHDVKDSNKDIYLRALTYEQNATLAEPLISKSIHERLEHIMGAIVDHIQDVTQFKCSVNTMVLCFKVDVKNQIWLISCNALKFTDELPKASQNVRFDQTKAIKLPSYIDQTRLLFQNTSSIIKDCVCFKCDKKFHQDDLMKMKLKHIIESWNFDHLGKTQQYKIEKKILEPEKRLTIIEKLRGLDKFTNKDENLTKPREIEQNYLVPDIIRKFFPYLKEKKYFELLSNPGFNDIDFQVCYECHIEIDKGVNVDQDMHKMAEQTKLINQNLKGRGQLQPQVTKKRFEVTRKEILNKIKGQANERNQDSMMDFKIRTSNHRKAQSYASLVTGLTPISLDIKQNTSSDFKVSMITLREFQYKLSNGSSRVHQNTTNAHSRKNSDR